MGEKCLVAKTDPITHVKWKIGHYAVHINANDIAAMGGTPLWFLATILVPPGTHAGEIEEIFMQISEGCKALGVAYCGGHTELTSAVCNPVVIGQMLGETTRAWLKPSSGAQIGDDLIMTKCAAIEGTAIMALEREGDLKDRFGEGLITRAKEYLWDPGISVVREAAISRSFEGVHALHDPTEGGLATGVYEMAAASGLGVEVHHDEIPVTRETRLLCDHYGVDPLGTFASGSLLIASSPSVRVELMQALRLEGIHSARIGFMTGMEEGMRLIKGARILPLPVYHQDELSRIFG
jgi:hydrogenase expression/formation protein HypE